MKNVNYSPNEILPPFYRKSLHKFIRCLSDVAAGRVAGGFYALSEKTAILDKTCWPIPSLIQNWQLIKSFRQIKFIAETVSRKEEWLRVGETIFCSEVINLCMICCVCTVAAGFITFVGVPKQLASKFACR